MHMSRWVRDPRGLVIASRIPVADDAPPAVGTVEFIDGSGLVIPDPRVRTSATRTARDIAAEAVDNEVDFDHPDRGPAPPRDVLERIRGAFGRVLRRGGR
jgi:hypothetical protein